MVNLEIARCCGSCKHVNKPRKPGEHAPHYAVSKTERWCYKYGIPTMREACCDDGYELPEVRSGAKINLSRILKQNERLARIKEISQWMIDNNIEEIPRYDNAIEREDNEPYCIYKVVDGIVRIATKWYKGRYNFIDYKDSTGLYSLERAVEEYKQTMNN